MITASIGLKIGDTERSFPVVWEPPVDLDGCGLAKEQINQIRQALKEESESFANSDDIGTVPDLELDIRVADNVPVKPSYMSVPRLLSGEVIEYLKCLLAKWWIKKSRSSRSEN